MLQESQHIPGTALLLAYHIIESNSQIWKFLRTDLQYNKLKVLAIRPEEVPSFRPSTVHYLNTVTGDKSIGVRSERKIFLDSCEPCVKVCLIVVNREACLHSL